MDDVEIIKGKVDLVEVISSYVPLKKMGRNMGGLCPFHGEKTPSFMVSPERAVWKCFGCGEGGDVFTFLEKIEGWDFKETLEELAKRVGVKLKASIPSDRSRVREKLYEINNLALKFYSHLLNNHPAGRGARKYLEGRGIGEKTWKKFGLGYSPDSWDTLFNFLAKRRIATSDVAMSGLVIARGGNRPSFYDRFRDRLIFPIADSRGQVMGFSGRVLEDVTRNTGHETRVEAHSVNSGQAKYINTSETPIFQKGSLLFGLDLARGAIREKNEAILVEGEFDVLSSYQGGVENVVASKGTALTDKQVAILSRLCESVVLCFDTDLAGGNASRRGIELLDMAGVNVKVADIGRWSDPDEFAQKDPGGYARALKNASSIYDYLIDSATKRFDPKDAFGQKKIGREILPVLSKITDDLVRAHYIEKLAKLLELDVSLVAEAVLSRSEDLETKITKGSTGGARIVMEDYFLALFLTGSKVVSKIAEILDPDDFEGETQRTLWGNIRDIIKRLKPKSSGKLVSCLPKDFKDFIDQLYLVNISPAFLDSELWAEELVKVAGRIKRKSLLRQVLAISNSLKEAQKIGDDDKILKLTKKFDNLSEKLKSVGEVSL